MSWRSYGWVTLADIVAAAGAKRPNLKSTNLSAVAPASLPAQVKVLDDARDMWTLERVEVHRCGHLSSGRLYEALRQKQGAPRYFPKIDPAPACVKPPYQALTVGNESTGN